MPEFLLYATRTEIHRYLLNNDQDERLNLGVTLQAAIAVDFDWHSNCLYWADIVEDEIHVSWELTTIFFLLPAQIWIPKALGFDTFRRSNFWP